MITIINTDKKTGITYEMRYDDNGYFQHAINVETGDKMMISSCISGSGYEITENKDFIKMDVCDARYYLLTDINVFVPRMLFIENNKI